MRSIYEMLEVWKYYVIKRLAPEAGGLDCHVFLPGRDSVWSGPDVIGPTETLMVYPELAWVES